MLRRLRVRGFKSLREAAVEFPSGLAVFFGPNAAGKSNLLEAVQALSAIGFCRTLQDALGGPYPVRGHAFESFSWPGGGLPALLGDPSRPLRFRLEADLEMAGGVWRYAVEPELDLRSGRLGIADEYLARLKRNGEPWGAATIERAGDRIHIRRQDKRGRPREEPVGANHSILSDASLSGVGYEPLDQVREELLNWRAHALDARTAMRVEQAPADVPDLGYHGERLAPFLYKLAATEPKYFGMVSRTLRSLVPGVEGVAVRLNELRGTLDLAIAQDGVDYPVRVVSEGTLRVLALIAMAANPWGGRLVAVEEPENGVHPRRVELIARVLLSLAEESPTQVLVATHSPLFAGAVLRAKRSAADPDSIGLFEVARREGQTVITPFDLPGELFEDEELVRALSEGGEEAVVEGLLRRGFVGG